jgi:hypothetical protein
MAAEEKDIKGRDGNKRGKNTRSKGKKEEKKLMDGEVQRAQALCDCKRSI